MRKLSVILSGAVSLGSYEAGVLTELLYALDHLARTDPANAYELDILTGASAGSMTAALVARAVMVDAAARRSLRAAWVDEIDIRDLLCDAPANAFLSKQPIEAIADRYLGPPAAPLRPASFAPGVLRMWFALSNMNGLDQALRYRLAPPPGFVATFYSDFAVFRLDRQSAGRPEPWRDIRAAAIASGNFPLAFAPALVDRTEADFRDFLFNPSFPGKFLYVDGGLFNNEPIGRAAELAFEVDGHQIARDRKFLLVDANMNRSSQRFDLTAADPLLRTAQRLASMVRGEASALDWLTAQRTNTQIGWRDTLLDNLVGIVKASELQDVDGFITRLEAAATEIVDHKRELFPERYPPDYLERSLARTAEVFRDDLARLGEAPRRRRIFVLLAFILNSVAGLDKKSRLDVDIIYTEKALTAGDQLQSFGGFFKRSWREHDYVLGRRDAHARLPRILDIPAYGPEPGAEVEYALRPEWKGFDKVTLRDADREPREAFRDAATRRLKTLIKDNTGAFGGVAAWIGGRFIKKKLSQALELD